MPKKIDANQTEVVQALRRVGAFVQSLADVGKGVPDLLVLFRGEIYLIELKDGAKPLSRQKLTPDEVEWIEKASYKGVTVHVVNSTESALNTIGAL